MAANHTAAVSCASCLPPSLPAATWVLIYCLVACITTSRDHNEARHCAYLMQQEQQRDGNISQWMWTAGVASPSNASGTMSSFPAFEQALDVKRPQQQQPLAPEATASSTRSSSPRKQQGKRHLNNHHNQQQQLDQDNMLHGAGGARVSLNRREGTA